MFRKVLRFYEVLTYVLTTITSFHLTYLVIGFVASPVHTIFIYALVVIGLIYLLDLIHDIFYRILEQTEEQYNSYKASTEEPHHELKLVGLVNELEETTITYPCHDNAPLVYNLKRHERPIELKDFTSTLTHESSPVLHQILARTKEGQIDSRLTMMLGGISVRDR